MSEAENMIPFEVDVARILEVVARQIYQTPLALLRENTQNAFDAILLRRQENPHFSPEIRISVSSTEVTVQDNGIGMDENDLREHYWKAGSSGKNNPKAKAAGVVGTFGIGAMANFGIAQTLTVTTEKLSADCSITSRAERDQLSTTKNCITIDVAPATGDSGTKIVAQIDEKTPVNVADAKKYITEFVSLVSLPVIFNGENISGKSEENLVPRISEAWHYEENAVTLAGAMRGDIELLGAPTGELWLRVAVCQLGAEKCEGRLVLRQGLRAIRTFRSGFGLAPVNLASIYGFGGVIDLPTLVPTAGREALTTESIQFLQSLMSAIDNFVSEKFGNRSETNQSNAFIEWAVRHGRLDLCDELRARIAPAGELTLQQIRERTSAAPMNSYTGSDQGVIKAFSSEDTPLILVARSNPRHDCELRYFAEFCNVESIADSPTVTHLKKNKDLTHAELSLAIHIRNILQSDYFLSVEVVFGRISHGLQAHVNKSKKPETITLVSKGPSVSLILDLYEAEYSAFSGMVKDFVRAIIFPLVSDLVPSSTRQGAEAFLNTIRKSKEVFEYETSDTRDFTTIWGKYAEGEITMEEAVSRSTSIVTGSVQVFDATAAQPVKEVIQDVVENEQALEQSVPELKGSLEPLPGIVRTETASRAKLLVIAENEPALRGYRCFLAITDRARRELGDIFVQPHTTSVVWGGQKAVFIFQHHSKQFGVYYDIQTKNVVAGDAGGFRIPTCTIVLKDQVYIPVPPEIEAAFVPETGERKRLEVRFDLLYTSDA